MKFLKKLKNNLSQRKIYISSKQLVNSQCNKAEMLLRQIYWVRAHDARHKRGTNWKNLQLTFTARKILVRFPCLSLLIKKGNHLLHLRFFECF